MKSDIRFVDEKTRESFYRLKDGDDFEKELFHSINMALDRIEVDAFTGIQIPKKLIPKEYLKKYGARNLWKYNLPNGWRLIYSIVNSDIIVISLVLEWFSHKDYDKRFGY